MEDITINESGGHESHICFRDCLEKLQSMIPASCPVFVVYDSNVSEHAGKIMRMVSPAASLKLEVSEYRKTPETVLDICSWLLDNGADRNAMLLAVGGGILTDMAGFAAAIYKRGITAAYVPTTLLAQVDASTGGKTGVNFRDYKNILGVIRQPAFTFICPEVLVTLPCSHVLEGAAEVIKSFIIKDGGNYSKAISFFSEMHSSGDRGRFMAENLPRLEELVHAAVAVKAEIVAEDPFETGIRRKLNLGHTFAHAIEWKDHGISHGRAVSIGLVCAAVLSRACGLCPENLPEMLEHDLRSCGMDTALPFAPDQLKDAMSKDKKAENGKVNFVMIRNIGDVITVPLPVGHVIDSLKANTIR